MLSTALAAGATIVTPNNRLARFLVAQFDDAQQRSGRAVWPAARALPWPTWLGSLWLEALGAGALSAPRPVASPAQAAVLWERIVASEEATLLDPRGAAAQAAEAWTLFHAWRRPDDRLEGWSRSGYADDPAAFARWAMRYRAALDQRGLADRASLADELAAAAPVVPAWRGRAIVAAGFIEWTPQQRRLFDALGQSGVEVTEAPLETAASSAACRVSCATPRDELARALEWARARAIADPDASIGIAIEDLQTRREEVLMLADELLCPELAVSISPDAARPYGISLGTPLADIPLVATALDLLTLSTSALPVTAAAALLRSAYLPGNDDAWRHRAGVERVWREQGARAISLSDAIATLLIRDRTLAARWQQVPVPGRGSRTPAQWAATWRDALDATGWPGDRTLSSGDWQAREAWSRLLAEFATLSAVAPSLAKDDALASLRGLASRTLFQPERPAPRIQILGLLEAAGMTFDALWIAGLTAERWPPSPQPDALLPLAWQRDRNVPRAHAERELAYARSLTAAFARAASEVVASHGRVADGYERAGTALTHAWVEREPDSFAAPDGHARIVARAAPRLETRDDRHAPTIAPGTPVRGGSGIVESQSTCPFQAFARYRLGSDAWLPASEGLTPLERGTLLHAALATLWNKLGDHAALVAIDDAALDAAIAAAVESARVGVDRRRWRNLPSPVAEGEAQRLGITIRAWLDSVERERPPFAVRAIEMRTALTLGDLALTLQIDRVDALADGGIVIIDYKSGRAPAPGKWFAPRPSGTQLGLYSLACKSRDPATPVRGVAYAQLKAGEIGVIGLAADSGAWPGLDVTGNARGVPGAWTDVETGFATRLGALADAFRSGDAAVAPRGAAACRVCELKTLCRVRALQDEAVVTGDADA